MIADQRHEMHVTKLSHGVSVTFSAYLTESLRIGAGNRNQWRKWRIPVKTMAMPASSAAAFAEATRVVVDLAEEVCQGRIVFTLEGGYNLEVLAAGGVVNLRLDGQRFAFSGLGGQAALLRRLARLVPVDDAARPLPP